MVWLALGLGTLLLVLWLLRLFAAARAETVRKVGIWALAGLGATLLVTMLFTGRGAQALWTLFLLGPVAWRVVQSRRSAWRFGRAGGDAAGGGGAGPGETGVETATLAMRLDHGPGRMSGRVRRGAFAGRELAELGLPELISLLADCRAADPESVPLLEAWLDRAAPDWREAEAWAGAGAGGGGGAARGSGAGAGPGRGRERGRDPRGAPPADAGRAPGPGRQRVAGRADQPGAGRAAGVGPRRRGPRPTGRPAGRLTRPGRSPRSPAPRRRRRSRGSAPSRRRRA